MSTETTPTDDVFGGLPAPPVEGATAEASSGEGGADLFEGVSSMGDILPIGVYHFRLEKFEKGGGGQTPEEAKASGADVKNTHFGDGSPIDAQPFYTLQWVCQQEPYTGRIVYDFVGWVSALVVTKAREGDQVARKLLKDRLWKAKSVMEGCGYKPPSSFNLEADFLGTNPECKIQLGIQEKKVKDPSTGQYRSSGEMKNKLIRYLPVNRPS